MLEPANSEATQLEMGEPETQEDSAWFPSAHQLLLPAKVTVARDWVNKRREGLKPWRQFFKTDKFKLPRGPATAGKRIVRNVEHFQSNYLCVFVVLFFYCILTSPMLLIALATCFGLLYIIRVKSQQGGIKLGGLQLSPAYQYGLVALLSFPLFYIAGAGSTIFWVIGASIFLILIHAVTYGSEPVPGAEFEMEEV